MKKKRIRKKYSKKELFATLDVLVEAVVRQSQQHEELKTTVHRNAQATNNNFDEYDKKMNRLKVDIYEEIKKNKPWYKRK